MPPFALLMWLPLVRAALPLKLILPKRLKAAPLLAAGLGYCGHRWLGVPHNGRVL